ncbi:MAG TPA: PIN domain-containing protein [Acidobacteriaceae bacterium]|nr:PIN domain-containing protein [Acidobacteriaceae bacterium]
MSRVFWDAMLLIYLLENNRQFAPAVIRVLAQSRRRGDHLLTSHLSVAEALVGFPVGGPMTTLVRDAVNDMGFELIDFGEKMVQPFHRLRRDFKLRAPDSMHLSCAAAAGTDLFLTGDKQLLSRHLHVPGIQFIADFEHPPF